MYDKLTGQEAELNRYNELMAGGHSDGLRGARIGGPDEASQAACEPNASVPAELDCFSSLVESAESKMRRQQHQHQCQQTGPDRHMASCQSGSAHQQIKVEPPLSTPLSEAMSTSTGEAPRTSSQQVHERQYVSAAPASRKLPKVGSRAGWQLKCPAFSTITLDEDDAGPLQVDESHQADSSGADCGRDDSSELACRQTTRTQQVCVSDAANDDKFDDTKVGSAQVGVGGTGGEALELFSCKEKMQLAAGGGKPGRLLPEAQDRGQNDRTGAGWSASLACVGGARGDGEPNEGLRRDERWSLCKPNVQQLASTGGTAGSGGYGSSQLSPAARAMPNDNQNGSLQRQTTTGCGRLGRSRLVSDCTTDGRKWTSGASSGPQCRAERDDGHLEAGAAGLNSAGSRVENFIRPRDRQGQESERACRETGARNMTNRRDAGWRERQHEREQRRARGEEEEEEVDLDLGRQSGAAMNGVGVVSDELLAGQRQRRRRHKQADKKRSGRPREGKGRRDKRDESDAGQSSASPTCSPPTSGAGASSCSSAVSSSASSSSSSSNSSGCTSAGQSNSSESKLQNYGCNRERDQDLDGQAGAKFGRRIIELADREAARAAAGHLSSPPRSIVMADSEAGRDSTHNASFAYLQEGRPGCAELNSLELERDGPTPTNDLVRTLLQRDRVALAPKCLSGRGRHQPSGLGKCNNTKCSDDEQDAAEGRQETDSDTSGRRDASDAGARLSAGAARRRATQSDLDELKQVQLGELDGADSTRASQHKRHSEDASSAPNSTVGRRRLNSSSVLDISFTSLMNKCHIGPDWQHCLKRAEQQTTLKAPPPGTGLGRAEVTQQPLRHHLSPFRLAARAIETMQAAAVEASSSRLLGATGPNSSSVSSGAKRDVGQQYRAHSNYMLPLLLLNKRQDTSESDEDDDDADHMHQSGPISCFHDNNEHGGGGGGCCNEEADDDDKLDEDKIRITRRKHVGGLFEQKPALRTSASSPSALSTPTNETGAGGCGGPCCSERAQLMKLARENLASSTWDNNARQAPGQLGLQSRLCTDNGPHDHDAHRDDPIRLSDAACSLSKQVGPIGTAAGANEANRWLDDGLGAQKGQASASEQQQQQQQQQQVMLRRRIGSNPLDRARPNSHLHQVNLVRANNSNTGSFKRTAPEQQQQAQARQARGSSASTSKRHSIVNLLSGASLGASGLSSSWSSHYPQQQHQQQQQQQQLRSGSLFCQSQVSSSQPRRTSGPSATPSNNSAGQQPHQNQLHQKQQLLTSSSTCSTSSSSNTLNSTSATMHRHSQPQPQLQSRRTTGDFQEQPLAAQYDPLIPESGFKIVVMGTSGSGKTAIIQRFLYGTFSTRHLPTVEDTYFIEFPHKKNLINISVSDTSGTYQFPAMKKLAINSGDAFILVYSVDDPQSFDDLEQLRQTILDEREQAYLDSIVSGGCNNSGNVGGCGGSNIDYPNSSSTSSSTSSGLGGVSQSSLASGAGGLVSASNHQNHSNNQLYPVSSIGNNGAQADHHHHNQDLSPSRHWSLASLFSHHNHNHHHHQNHHNHNNNSTGQLAQQQQQHYIFSATQNIGASGGGGQSSLSSSVCSASTSCSSSADNSRRSSISAAEAALRTRRTRKPPMVIVANKHDLPKDRHLVNTDEIEALAVIDWNNGFVRASAALNWNIDEIFKQVLKQARQPPTLTEAIVSKRRKSLPPKLPHP